MKAIFVEGRFALTNQMLSDLRAAGVYVGKRRKLLPGFDRFAVETRTIRMLTKVAARKLEVADVPLASRLHVGVVVVGHERHDPDGWLLLGKAAVDGLRDAGVIASDRFQIGLVSGMVLQTAKQHAQIFEWADEVMGRHAPSSNVKGFFLTVSQDLAEMGCAEPFGVAHA